MCALVISCTDLEGYNRTLYSHLCVCVPDVCVVCVVCVCPPFFRIVTKTSTEAKAGARSYRTIGQRLLYSSQPPALVVA